MTGWLAFFSGNVNAQSDSQAQLLLQVQQMRQEIAELRDQVERQSFQLKKLQQAQSTAVDNVSRASNRQQSFNTASDGEFAAQAQPLQIQPSLEQQLEPRLQTAVSVSNAASVPPTSASVQEGSFVSQPQQAKAVQSQQAEAAQSQQAQAVQPQQAQVTPEVVSAAPVVRSENGAVDLSGAAPAVNATQRQFPPVVDRSITSDNDANFEAYDPETDPNTVFSASELSTANNTVPVALNEALPAKTLPSSASPNTNGVIGVPSALPETTASQTTAPQTTTPQTIGQNQVVTPQVAAAQPAQPSVAPVVPSSVQQTVPSSVQQPAPSGTAQPSSSQQATTANQAAVAEESASAVSQALLPEGEYYQQGFELLKQSRHNQAVSVFTQQINAYPQGDLADDAYYWIAESMYVNRKLSVAKSNFKTIIDNYAQSPRVPDAMLKIAYIEQDQGNKIEARLLLQDIMQFHPSSNAAISAKNRLSQLK